MVHPSYGVFWVPPGHEVVVMASAPPDAVTVTWAVAVLEPAALLAVRV
jgi:hypothetical protein